MKSTVSRLGWHNIVRVLERRDVRHDLVHHSSHSTVQAASIGNSCSA